MIKKVSFIFLFLVIGILAQAETPETYIKCDYNEGVVYFKEGMYPPSQKRVIVYKIKDNHIYLDDIEVGDYSDDNIVNIKYKYNKDGFIIIESASFNRVSGVFINEKSIGTNKTLYLKTQGAGSCRKVSNPRLF